MSSSNNSSGGRKSNSIFRMSVGKLLVILMAAYFIFTFISYRDQPQVSFYEVEEGSLVKEHNYTGVILRDEEIFNSADSGYIYYNVADGKKAAKGSPVYSIDESGQLMNYLAGHSEEISELGTPESGDLRNEIMQASRTFNPGNFRNLYTLKNTIDAHTIEYSSINIFNLLSDELAANGITYKSFNSEITGIVCCYTDGYEKKTEDDLSGDLFDTGGYEKKVIKAGDLVSADSPAYKMITCENWKIAFPMAEEDVSEFANESVIRISFIDKGFSTRADFKIVNGKDGKQYGVISLNSFLIQFASDRFVDFEIVTNDVSGLKIPQKSVITKDFYTIPSEYLVTDENGNKGFYKAEIGVDGTTARFVMPEIFEDDGEYCYIDCNEESAFQAGDFIMSSPEYADKVAAMESGDGASETKTVSENESQPVSGDDTGSLQETDSTSSESGQAEEESSDDSGQRETDGRDEAEESPGSDTADETSESPGSDGSETDAADKPYGEESEGTDRSGELYRIETKKSLNGVYNVNKGYTVFKKVEILETSNGYSIVEKNSSYGLQVYDHIVLDASTVHDGQILYR